MIRVGTAGFHYKDWVGPFYPKEEPQSRWLEYYAREFDTCELNYTYYRLPDARQLAGMADRVPDAFRFSLKAFKGITHERENVEAHLAGTLEAVTPLQEEGKLGALLLQFPYSFRPDREAVELLETCRAGLPGVPLVAEFRNREWARDRAYDFLRRLEIGFCCVDEPCLPGLMPPVAVSTADISYVRFHGRNAAKWWHHEEAWERYDYSYTQAELAEWVPRIARLDQESEVTYVYTNNHWQGQAVDTARQLRLMLESPSE